MLNQNPLSISQGPCPLPHSNSYFYLHRPHSCFYRSHFILGISRSVPLLFVCIARVLHPHFIEPFSL